MGRKQPARNTSDSANGAPKSAGKGIPFMRGSYYFKQRWPTDIRRRHPDLPEFFERSLRTKDPKTAREAAAPLTVEFNQRCREYRAPSPQDRVQEWVANLPPEGKRELMAFVEQRLGRERELDLPPDAPAEIYNDKDEGPNWYIPIPDEPSENPFLKTGRWMIPEKDVVPTPAFY